MKMKTTKINKVLGLCLVSVFFVFTKVQAQYPNVYYQIVSIESKMALVTNGQTVKGSTVYKKDASLAGDGGLWTFIQKDDYYLIKNKHSGLYLAAMTASRSGEVIKITDTPGPGALWKLYPDKDYKRFVIKNKANSLVIDNMGDTQMNSTAKFNMGNAGDGTKWLLVSQ
jgi:hypothetical protein